MQDETIETISKYWGLCTADTTEGAVEATDFFDEEGSIASEKSEYQMSAMKYTISD